MSFHSGVKRNWEGIKGKEWGLPSYLVGDLGQVGRYYSILTRVWLLGSATLVGSDLKCRPCHLHHPSRVCWDDVNRKIVTLNINASYLKQKTGGRTSTSGVGHSQLHTKAIWDKFVSPVLENQQ